MGKGLYLRNLIAPYAKDFVGLATKGHTYFDYPLIQKGFPRYHLWHQASVPGLLRKLRADIFLAPYNTAPLVIPKQTQLVLVLHDLILLRRFTAATLKQQLDNEYRRMLVYRAVSRAHIVVTVSAYVKREIEEHFPGKHVHLIPNTIAHSWFIEQPLSVEDRDNYILTITSDAPHKNAWRALEAYAALVSNYGRADVPRLRIVGLGDSPRQYCALARSLQIETLVDFEAFVPERDLQELYRRAKAALIPSLQEGFGIPVLEGMASGTPVITSQTTSLPEVGGLAARYFDPTDVGDMAHVLEEVLSNPEEQKRMIKEGLLQAKRFHPDVVGQTIRSFWDTLSQR